MRINGFHIFLALFLSVVLASGFYEPLRYLRYFLPLLALLVFLARERFVMKWSLFSYYAPFLIFYVAVILYLLILNIATGTLSSRFFPNAVFILAPLVFITFVIPYFNYEKAGQYVKVIFWLNAILFLSQEGADLLVVLTDLEVLKSALYSSVIPTENQAAFVFGFLVLYFLIERGNKFYLITSIIFLLLSYKRVVLGAVAVCSITYYLLAVTRINVSRNKSLWTVIGTLLNLGYIKVTQLMVSGSFDRAVEQKTGFSTDQFLMGRKTFYTAAFDHVGPITWKGIGLGQIDDIILESYGLKMNLHSEILKNYFEFGAIIFVGWLFIFIYKNLFSNSAALLLIYMNILMLTDNVFIYFEVMFYFYFFILIALSQTTIMTKHSKQSIS